MAYATDTRAHGASLSQRFADLRSTVTTYLAQRRVYTETLRELDQLNDRDLTDLGIHRSQLRTIAREAAYGRD